MTMRTLAVLATLAISLWQSPLASAQSTDDDLRDQVRIQTSNAALTGERLQTAGFDVTRVNPAGRSVDLVVTGAERDALACQGFRVTTLDRVRPLREAAPAASSLTMAAAAVPAGDYPDLGGIETRMQDLAATYQASSSSWTTATYGTPRRFRDGTSTR